MTLALAPNDFGEPDLTGWWIGLIIGFVVVVVVVVVVGWLLTLAAQIGGQAGEAIQSLEATRATTQPLTELGRVNDTLQSILRGAVTARKALGG